MICDINKSQGAIDWDAFAPCLDFVQIKASGKWQNQGDPYYAANVAGAVAHGVAFHAFHFLYCLTEAEARRDAALFFSIVRDGGHWPLFWMLDCEAEWGVEFRKARRIAEVFEAELRQLCRENGPGEIRVAMYIGHNRYREYALDYDRYAYVEIPRYGDNTGRIEDSIRPDFPHDLWQFTSRGNLPGIRGIGRVDLTVLNGEKQLEYYTKPAIEKGGDTVSKLIQTQKLVEMLVDALNRKDGYIMGAYGQNPRTGYLDLSVPESKCKAAWKPDGYYYNQYKDNAKQHTQALKWRADCTRVWDCNGLAEGIYELCTGTNINSKARHNYAEWCNPKGAGMIPVERRVPGAAVFWSDSTAAKIHHVAYLWKPVKDGHPEGDWYLIEAKGVMYGVVKSKLNSRKPNFWGWMSKYYDYTEAPAPAPEPPKPSTLGDRELRKGCKGDDVAELQRDLLKLGYSLPKYGADGDFGSETEKTVRVFQVDHNLTPDGVMHSDDFSVLFAALDGETPAPAPVPAQMVEITGDTVNVRNAPGTTGTRVIGIARKGEKYHYGGSTAKVDGRDWYMIDFKGREGWITSKFSKLVSA